MQYKGEVTLTFRTPYGIVYSYTEHNGGTANLQLAFANMLCGLSTRQFIPQTIRGGFGTAKITGRNRRQGSNPDYYVQFNAIVPIDGDAQNMLTGYTYNLYGEDNIQLASFTSNATLSQTIIDQLSTTQEGLQLNISWKMYLGLDLQ